jgi:hypothetical protein
MTTLHPLASLEAWLRFACGLGVIVAAPGYVWLGRHLSRGDLWFRTYASLAFGLLLAASLGRALSLTGLPLTPLSYLAVALGLGAGLGCLHRYRQVVSGVAGDGDRGTPWLQVALLGGAVLHAAVVIWGIGDHPVPASLHDAPNHAYLTARIAQTGSAAASAVFAPPFGVPAFQYLTGWHTAAALIARTANLAPYIAAWMLPLTCLFLTAPAAALLWRRCGLPLGAVVGGVYVALAGQAVPLETLYWGGFGLMAGLFAAPLVALLLARFARAAGPWEGLLAGLGVASLIRIHASEAAAVVLLAALVLATAAGPRRPRFAWPGVAAFVAAIFLLAGLEAIQLAKTYQQGRMAAPDHVPWRESLRYATQANGVFLSAQILLAGGVVAALRRRRVRPVALAALALAGLVVAIQSLGEVRLVQWLASPFYREAGRVQALQYLLVPPLVALPPALLYRLLAPSGRLARWVGGAVAVLAVALVLREPLQQRYVPALRGTWLHEQTNFADDEYRTACQIAAVVPDTCRVANFWDDGSAWAMHVSGREFICPAGWATGVPHTRHWREASAGLVQDPWPDVTLELPALGVTHVWVSDLRVPRDDVRFRREVFDRDPRFTPVLRGEHVALYRIGWDDGGGWTKTDGTVAYGAGWGGPEPWGRWIQAAHASLLVTVPPAGRPLFLVLAIAPHELQDQPQAGTIACGADTLGRFTVAGAPWIWQEVAVPLPPALAGRAVGIDVSLAHVWQGTDVDPRPFGSPVQRVFVATR